MPTAMIIYRLPEEQEEYRLATEGVGLRLAVGEMLDEVRRQIKYCDPPEEYARGLEEAQRLLLAAMDVRGVRRE